MCCAVVTDDGSLDAVVYDGGGLGAVVYDGGGLGTGAQVVPDDSFGQVILLDTSVFGC